MVALRDVGLAAEHPVRVAGVGQDDRQQDRRAHQQEGEARVRGDGFVDRERERDDVRVEADPQADEGKLIPRPTKERTTRPSAHRKGERSSRRLSLCHARQASSATNNGTGLNNARFGQENQRSAIAAWWNGDRIETPKMAATRTAKNGLARRKPRACGLSLVLMISQPQPKRA
jgi:hypothetical protein